MQRLHNGRVTRRAQQRQLPNRPHKLRYERSCGNYVFGYNGYCFNCWPHTEWLITSSPYNHRFPKGQ